MNFFKSVFSDDPDPPLSPPRSANPAETQEHTAPDDEGSDPDQPSSNQRNPETGWSFGGLMKTLQVKSDWIDTYRRDLEEFGSGLRKETEILREAASKAVKVLPNSIEISASKAQTSLESVGQTVDSIGSTVWKSTAEIISQGKESFLAPADSDSSDISDVNNVGNLNVQSVNSGRYSRFDTQLGAIQCDANTYIEEPEDVSDYNEWKSGFDLEEKSDEIEGLMRENESIDGIYRRVVPNTVDHHVFWSRYYYRAHRLTQAENVRAKLVKRAISTADEEELSWDVDEEEEEEVEKVDGSTSNESGEDHKKDNDVKKEDLGDKDSKISTQDGDKVLAEDSSAQQRVGMNDKLEGTEENKAAQPATMQVWKNEIQYGGSEGNDGEVFKKSEEKIASEAKTEPSESGKDSDISVVSTQPSAEEDDMGWDEIEDVGSEDEKKVTQIGSPDRAELRKRLSVPIDEDEDLSWDIEDDDEPVKA